MGTESPSGLIIRVALALGILALLISYGLNYLQTQGLSKAPLAETTNTSEVTEILNAVLSPKGASETPHAETDEIIIPLTRKGRSLFVQAELNEYREATLLVDTGASEVALTPEVAYDLGLIDGDTPEAMYMTANGQVSSYITTIESLRLGNTIQYDIPVSINSTMTLEGFGDGLLGMSFFERYIVFVDSVKGELHLRPREF